MSHERFRTALVAAALLGSAAAVAFLPGQLPRAFGVPPGIDVWVSRLLSAFFLPFVALACTRLLGKLAAADPNRANYRRFPHAFNVVLDSAVVLVIGLHAALMATLLLGPQPWIGRLLPLLLGILIAVVGNILPRVRLNAVVGVPTPWARSSERAWARAHRWGGYLLVALGLFVALAGLFVDSVLGWLIGGAVAVSVPLLVAFTWLAARKEDTSCDHLDPHSSSSPHSPSLPPR